MRSVCAFTLLACLVLAGCAAGPAGGRAGGVADGPEGRPIKIVIAGDSTVAAYPASVPDRGWGQFIGDYFDSRVTVVNLAKNGRSTKTFLGEGLWKQVLAEKPDYVLIQFGHNDSHAKDRPESTDAETDFRQYLRQYVDEARAAGALPVLVTPVQRRTYDAAGQLDNSLLPYAQAMKVVGREKSVPVIDLNASSGELYRRLGEKANSAVSRNGTDATHFNERGARWMAALVMRDLLAAEPRLAAHVEPGRRPPAEIDISLP